MDHVDPIGTFWNHSWKFTKKRKTERCFIDGVVLVDPEYVKDRKVYASVLAGIILIIINQYLNFLFFSIAFRYGREDLDVLGLTFRKDLFCSTQQIYPPIDDQKKSLTHLQQRLLRKLGPNAYPFYFEVYFPQEIFFC